MSKLNLPRPAATDFSDRVLYVESN